MKINFNDNVSGVQMRVSSGGNGSTEEKLMVHPGCLRQISGICGVFK